MRNKTEVVQQAKDSDASDADQTPSKLQHVLDSSEYSEESEFDWEDVELENDDQDLDEDSKSISDEPLFITIGGSEPSKQQTQRKVRKPITSAEKKMRLDVHKSHILFLLFHCFVRNQWCNDSRLQVCWKIGL
jgi:xeroderma pigmentosum group C-complementing protein